MLNLRWQCPSNWSSFHSTSAQLEFYIMNKREGSFWGLPRDFSIAVPFNLQSSLIPQQWTATGSCCMNGGVDKKIPPGIQCCLCPEPPQQLAVTAPQQHYIPKFLNFGADISYSTFCLLRRGKFCNTNIMKR